ncbi:MAG: DUF945 domain-containing protein [Comamonadaceae bacterium]|nr:MAG: DUF945 domain-containing protein [Comamonadaceae bacterium]
MSNKKMGVAAAVAVAVVAVAYGGGTWYLGQRTEAKYQDAVAELRKALGAEAVVSDEYHRGFLSSQARLVLQWTAKPVEGAPAQPLRVVVNSDVRHGPLAGARIAAAVVESRFALEGLDAKATALLAKATSPTLTSVHHLTGAHDLKFALPPGQVGDGEVTLGWQELVYDMAISRKGDHIQGSFRMPEFSIAGISKTQASALAGVDEEEEEDEEGVADDTDESRASAETAAGAVAAASADVPKDRMSMAVQGMEGTFDNAVIDGLWGIGPGKASYRIARIHAGVTPAAGGDVKPQLDLKDIQGAYVIEATDTTIGFTSDLKGTGRIGPIDLESISMQEKVQRIDIEAVRAYLKVALDSYRAGGVADVATALQTQGQALLMQNAPRLVAALPAYGMKLQATYQGQTGQLEYGGEVQRAPTDAELAQGGWVPALIKGSMLHAGARIPKAWLMPIMQSTGKAEVKPEEVDAMVGMAQSAGYVVQEGDVLTSTIKFEAGQLNLNGKTTPLPPGLLR